MVAAGATGLMSASESGSSKEAENITNYRVKNAQRSCESPGKTSVKVEKKNSLRSPSSNKTAISIRETKASRLRAASIVSPTESSPSDRKSLIASNSSTGTNSRKSKSPMSSTGRPTSTSGYREKDKTPKRISGATKCSDIKEKQTSSFHEKIEKTRMRKNSNKLDSTTSSPSDSPGCCNRLDKDYKTTRTSSANPCSSGIVTPRSSIASDNSEVSRRVDALTALTRATMERVERLSRRANPSSSSVKNPSTDAKESKTIETSISIETTRQQIPPISILKHKTTESDSLPSSEIFPSLVVQQFTKKHGILKKRCSLDDNEILRRRRSCSPDTVNIENNCVGFKPILLNVRRSSLDELVKRSRSPDQLSHSQPQHPTSILKRKSSGEDEREEGQSVSTEPTSILKRSSGSNGKPVVNHVSIVAAVAKTLGCTADSINGNSEVRPILKKKYSREEYSSSESGSLEPRPILKKKSSTDSDEHDEKPKKTILKCSRKSSQEDSGNEIDGASPKKLSMLKNRSIQRRTNSLPECDVVRPILKQCSPRESSSPSRSSLSGTASPGDEISDAVSKNLFLRKRARSVGHLQSSMNRREDWLEVEDSCRHEKSEKFIDTSCPGQNITWLNESTATAITNTTASATTNRTTATTSSIASVVSFKLSSRQETTNRHRYETRAERILKDDHNERKINVSQIAQRFKALESQVTIVSSTSEASRTNPKTRSEKYRKYSNEIPKNERFNTQPVTYEEVKEAVLQNQRNAAVVNKISTNREQSNDLDPSKLSLADRVRMFNERISTENIAKVGISMDRSQRRRPSNRYKTQPITSEEVEVAARNFPSEEIVEPRVSRTISHSREALQIDNVVQPRSILKYCQPVGDNFTETVDSCSRRLRSSRCVTTFVTNSLDYPEQNTDVEEYKEKMNTEMINLPNTSIADRLAALEKSGTTDWKRRVNAEIPSAYSNSNKQSIDIVDKDEASSRQQKLAERLEKLESAAEGWRKRVAAPDAVKFSVAGKMMGNRLQVDNLQIDKKLQSDGRKKMPNPERFRGNKSTTAGKTITSSQEDSRIREISLDRNSEEKGGGIISTNEKRSIWEVPRADDETFTSFFSNISLAKCEAETLDVVESDFDFVTSFSERLGSRRTTKTQRRRLQSKNPLRTLAARTDIRNEYTEMTTGVAERVMRSLNLEKLGKNSSLAVEALAGLASSEDFSSVTLKNVDADSTGYGNSLPPYKDPMLILIKGRRHVQVRLVEPVASSINSGDNYILVTKNQLYNYVGKYSNVIERARGAEIALSIQQNKDLGCRASQVITVSEEKVTCSNDDIANFWKILGVDNAAEVTDGGHPDEDELYESALTETNMVYEVVGEYELSPIEKYWGTLPKIEMLDPSKILVFDFGSEMYIWNGKIAPPEMRKVATLLAEELWREGYDYSECTVSPIDSASIIGRRKNLENNEKKAAERPKWCLIAKLTQHMETILFREKFLDWPNVTGILRVKKENEKEQVDGKVIVEPPRVDSIVDSKSPVVDLVLEGSHLGRGSGWYDDELMRQSVVSTTNVTVWHIDEYSYSLLDASSIGQFYTGDSYIVRWMYTITNTGRGLDGEPSRHAAKGRDRCAYFIWQGQKASLNEKGTAALLTVELDQEQGPQIRVVEGFEPAAFLNLFSGRMIVHMGKRSKNVENQRWRLYTYRGNEKSEICLIQVPRSSRQLRSRGALLLIDGTLGEIYVWYGHAAIDNIKKNIMIAAKLLKENRPEEVGLSRHSNVTINSLNESDEEPAVFYQALGGMNKQLYASLNEIGSLVYTPRLFRLSSVSGEFSATELLCPHRTHGSPMPFPFLQDELYQVNQPALFLLDNKDELWLWQGWWPDGGSEDQTGSGAVRWQAERRAAMVMAVRYWKKRNPKSNECPVYLAWAGLEPLAFTNLFPTWTLYDEIAELNIKDGRDPGQVLEVEGELARLTQSTYPPAELLQRPLPEGVDPTILEQYLSPQHFEELLGMNIEEYEQLPAWKQRNIKKKIGLF